MEERFAVTAATGALGPVLVNLAALLGDEYKLQEGTRRDIVSIKSDLEPVHDLLGKLWGREDIHVACKDWMAEARELSYDLEDGINGFSLGLEQGDGGFIQREAMDSPFKEFMERVKEVSKRCGKMQTLGEATICSRSELTTDPRALFLPKDASELVGMEEKKEELIGLLQEHEMVCIFGFAGMGKTTLAHLVYHTKEDQFQYRAFVSVHQSPNMMKVLSLIHSQVTNGAITSAGSGTEPAGRQNIIKDISISLSYKRYMVIIDDIWHWEDWEVIRKALPKNNNMDSKIIMTTRVKALAERCQTEQGAHVYNLAQSLSLDFDNLPVQMRTCLLYCSIYPLGYSIQRDSLVTKWIAEGFVLEQGVPEAYFDKLISWNLLQPVPKYEGFYIVHPIILAFLVCKAKEDNFVSCGQHNNGCGSSSAAKKIRRLSLYTDCNPEEDVSHIRFLAVLGFHPKPDDVPLKNYKNLRVLQIDSGKSIGNGHLMDICQLLWLRCLDLNGCLDITEIPREIRILQNLETLEMRSTGISKLPMEIGTLKQLRTLNVSGTMVTEVPWEITGLSRLENLDLSYTEVAELPKELGKLQHLRTLDIRVTKVRELSCRQVPNSFLCVVGHFDSTSGRLVKLPLDVFRSSGDEEVISSSGANCREGLSILVLFNHFDKRCDVLPVPMHRVVGRHMSVPQWVKQDLNNVISLDIRLCKLEPDDLEFLKKMPNLQALALRLEVLPRELIAITRGGFRRLETFYVDCRLPRVITFEEGAMPKLKHLEFKFYTGTARQDHSMGIKNLPELGKVVVRCSEYYTSHVPGISASIEVVRKEAEEHPNEITLYVNNMKPEVFRSGATWISPADRAIIIRKEIEEREKEKQIAEREKRIGEQRFQLLRAAEGRAQRNKSNSKSSN